MTTDGSTRANGERRVRRFQACSTVAAAVTAAVGGTVLVGWLQDVAALKSLLPGLVTMKVNTALGFVLSGVALWLQTSDKWRVTNDEKSVRHPSPDTRHLSLDTRFLAQAGAGAVALLGLLTLVEYAGGWDFGIDNLIFAEPPGAIHTSQPGRMAPTTAFSFLLSGLALVLLDARGPTQPRPAQFLILPPLVIALLAVIGYLYGAWQLIGLAPHTPMALNTALGFFILSVGVLLARPDAGWMTVFSNHAARGIMTRRLVPVAILLPIALGWLRVVGELAGLYPSAFGAAVMVVVTVALLLGLTGWTAASLHAADAQRARTETALRESETRFRELTESLPQLVWTCLPDGRCDYLSRQWVEYTGIPEQDQLGYGWAERVHPDDRATLLRTWQHAVETGGYFDVEFRIRRADGDHRWFKTRATPMRDAAGQVIKWFGTNTDVEAHKQREETLRAGEEINRITFEQAAVGITHVAPDGHWLRVNDRFCAIVGYSREDLSRLTFQDITHPDDLNTDLEFVRQMLAGEIKTYSMEKRYLRKDRSLVWISLTASLVRTTAGEPRHFISIVQDIHDRKQAEAERELLTHTLAASFNEIYIFDATAWHFRFVSTGALKNLGYTLEQLRQMTPLDLTPAFDRAAYDRLVGPLLRREKPLQLFETVHRRANGSLYPVEVRLQLFERGEDRVFFAVILDTTERKRLEQERAGMEAQLRQQQKLESIGTLASGVAHEINNPITGIMNYAQLIQDRLPAESPLTEFTGEILRETGRVGWIVHNLLTFARNEKQSHSPSRMIDIDEGTLSLIRTVIRHDQIELTVDMPEDLPELKCRNQQIQQVLMNLMTNARDALNERYTGHHPNKVMRVAASLFEKAGRRWIRVTVEDHGTGITSAVRERMFDPFFTTKPRDKGTGLGLAISHGIVKEHHGEFTVESEPGQFTRLHLDLPVDNGWEI
jgi:PAS domain S-box-containing protein